MRDTFGAPYRRRGYGWWLLAVGAALALAGCGGGSSGSGDSTTSSSPSESISVRLQSACSTDSFPSASFDYAVSHTVPAQSVELTADMLEFSIPETAVAVGVALQGTTTNFKVTDHGMILADADGNPMCITAAGKVAPVAFNQLDWNDDGTFDDDITLLFDHETTALFFPNDGAQLTLPSGTYAFPMASLNSDGNDFEADSVTARVWYKTASKDTPTLNVNLFVVDDVTLSGDPTTDTEIQGAVDFLERIYESSHTDGSNSNIEITVSTTVRTVGDTTFAIISSQEEIDELLSSFPSPAENDAVNLFVVDQLQDFVPDGVIGLASRIPGPFERDGTIMSGVLAEYQSDETGDVLGYILAHELGHYLGLYHTTQWDSNQAEIIGHDPIDDTPVCGESGGSLKPTNTCEDKDNFMFPFVESPPPENPIVSSKQANVVRLNPAVP